MADDFSNDALVLIAHGSTVNAQSSAPTRRLADELRARNIFAEVACAFNLEQPKIDDVPKLVSAQRIFVVPVTISEGHFTEQTIPHRLGLLEAGAESYERIQQRDGRTIIYCHPIGTHPSMTDVLLARAREVVAKHPFPRAPKPSETALFIAGHGTEKNANSRKAIEAQVEAIAALGEYADVQPVFMEEAPFIADCFTATEAPHIVMVPFFIADGLHTVEDIPVLLGEPEARVKKRLAAGQPTWRNPTERKGKLVWYTEAIGSKAGLAEVILARVEEGNSQLSIFKAQ
ncbi:MAG TPA: cobalamin biosynthesis protein CbiX [Verrucomicrobiales bacterium]|jgi:sirohydrochlorin cobaltochelatase|nr:cobalamin biosynthesis protein CbiX [Verrucomicrobiales bacterium]HIL24814.1 cobalamin biosynthesis protein CbiX [Verrucomicrobiota bacterium]